VVEAMNDEHAVEILKALLADAEACQLSADERMALEHAIESLGGYV
jgi:hypothetical protein